MKQWIHALLVPGVMGLSSGHVALVHLTDAGDTTPTPEPAMHEHLQPPSADDIRPDNYHAPAPDLDEGKREEPPQGLEPQGNQGFQAASCTSGFIQAGSRLCISSSVQGATTYANASYLCISKRSRVCTYEDFTYIFYATSLDATYNPISQWIGNMTDDDAVMCGNYAITYDNDPDINNFEDTCNKADKRAYRCCYWDSEG